MQQTGLWWLTKPFSGRIQIPEPLRTNYSKINETAILFLGRECWDFLKGFWEHDQFGRKPYIYRPNNKQELIYVKYYDALSHMSMNYSNQCMYETPLTNFSEESGAPYVFGFLQDVPKDPFELGVRLIAALSFFRVTGHPLESKRIFIIDPKNLCAGGVFDGIPVMKTHLQFCQTGLPDIGGVWWKIEELFDLKILNGWATEPSEKTGIIIEGGEETGPLRAFAAERLVPLKMLPESKPGGVGEIDFYLGNVGTRNVTMVFATSAEIGIAASREMLARKLPLKCSRIVAAAATPQKTKLIMENTGVKHAFDLDKFFEITQIPRNHPANRAFVTALEKIFMVPAELVCPVPVLAPNEIIITKVVVDQSTTEDDKVEQIAVMVNERPPRPEKKRVYKKKSTTRKAPYAGILHNYNLRPRKPKKYAE